MAECLLVFNYSAFFSWALSRLGLQAWIGHGELPT